MHPDGVRTRADDEHEATFSRFFVEDELESLTQFVTNLNELPGSLDIVAEIHDEKGVLLGVVRRHDDNGYCFFAEPGGVA